MTLINPQKRAAVLMRRSRVAALLNRKPNIHQWEIVETLQKAGIVNPESGEPWSQATISSDIRAVSREWERDAKQEIGELKAKQLARLDELEGVAWNEKRYDLVLKVEERKAKLLGLDAPARSEVTGVDGGPLTFEIVRRATQSTERDA